MTTEREELFPNLLHNIAPLDSSVKLSIQFTNIEATQEEKDHFNELRYNIDIDVHEAIKRPDNSAIIHFSIKANTNPKVAAFKVEGNALVRGPADRLHSLMKPEANSPPPIWKDIYREAMTVISTLSRFFNVPAPPIVIE